MTKMQAKYSECKHGAFLEIGQDLERQGHAHGIQDGKEINHFLRDRSPDRREITESRRYHTHYAERHAADRTTWLRKNRTPEDLIRFWLGHADETVTDGYSKLREDVQYRSEVADKVGLGFEISPQTPDVVPNVPSLELATVQQNAA